MTMAERIADLLADEEMLDVTVACAIAAAYAIRELPVEQRERARQAVHGLIDDLLEEWISPI